MKDIINQILYVVIIGTLPSLVLILRSFLKSKVVQAMGKNDELSRYAKLINIAERTIDEIVISVSQTYVDTLKSQGKFDKNAQIEAKKLAIDKAKLLLVGDIKEAVCALYGDFDQYLDTMVESFVKQNK